eukprot:3615233-Pyramimonas_sp.AAC.1
MTRVSCMPAPFVHPRRGKKPPDPSSKRQKKLRALPPAAAAAPLSPSAVHGEKGFEREQDVLNRRWEALGLGGWSHFPPASAGLDGPEADPFQECEEDGGPFLGEDGPPPELDLGASSIDASS